MVEPAALYERLTGQAWTQIAEPVRCLHRTDPIIRAGGQLRVEHGSNPLARVLVWMLRLPRSRSAADVRLKVTARGGAENWQRTFDGRRLHTCQYESRHSELAERFGLLEFRYGLRSSAGSLLYVQREAAFVLGQLRVRLPAMWAPRIEAREDPAGPKEVNVNVRIVLPGLGPLITYDGVVVIEDAQA